MNTHEQRELHTVITYISVQVTQIHISNVHSFLQFLKELCKAQFKPEFSEVANKLSQPGTIPTGHPSCPLGKIDTAHLKFQLRTGARLCKKHSSTRHQNEKKANASQSQGTLENCRIKIYFLTVSPAKHFPHPLFFIENIITFCFWLKTNEHILVFFL